MNSFKRTLTACNNNKTDMFEELFYHSLFLKRKFLTITIIKMLILSFVLSSCTSRETISITFDKTAEDEIIMAADELTEHFSKIYTEYNFRKNTQASKTIILEVNNQVNSHEEAYRLKTNSDSDTLAVIQGSDSKGLLYGVYDFLSMHGVEFLLSETIFPKQKEKILVFDTTLINFPHSNRRLVFNWHNFLTGVTSWNFREYKSWIDQSRRMKYNTIMLHFYGNNPSFRFTHNGLQKEVGYIANSVRGRDWGIAHVNDVRRMTGGKLFSDKVFGANITKVPDDERAEASKKLIQQVFQYAENNGMEICLAIDFDTKASNPQKIIRSLPDSAKFKVNNNYCARPDVKEGYAYYKSQIEKLKADYPQIDMFTVWFRRNGWLQAMWREIKEKHLPDEWKKEYLQLKNQFPEIEDYDNKGASDFAISKIVSAIEKICEEINYDVELSIGSWDYKFMPQCDIIYPEHIAFIPLDYYVVYDQSSTDEYLNKINTGRKIIPIIWAHHDDFTYTGRPYIPFKNFAEINQKREISDFGIIHWTTHPLDMYFRNISNQVWDATLNEDYKSTCFRYANKLIPGNKYFAEYVYQWHTESPQVGRETTDYFMHHSVELDSSTTKKSKERLALLKKVDTNKIRAKAVNTISYFKNIEAFCSSIVEYQFALNNVLDLIEKDRSDSAKEILSSLYPEQVINHYVQAITSVNPTRGEIAMLLSLNLRWLPDFLSAKQQTGLEPVLINYAPTQHETFAQAAGRFAYWIDKKKQMWNVRGKKETGCKAILSNENQEIEGSWIVVDSITDLKLNTIRYKPLTAGDFVLNILSNNKFRYDIISNNNIIASDRNSRIKFQNYDNETILRIYPDNDKIKLFGLKIEKKDD